FIVRDVQQNIYTIMVSHKGYVPVDSADTNAFLESRYLPGERIIVRMTKGGVITGRVIDQNGQPIIGILVSAVRTHYHDGSRSYSGAEKDPIRTDDRGIYRIYGLVSGTYLVRAGGRTEGNDQYFINPYVNSPFIYYPSDQRVTAKEIVVSGSTEISGIDITFKPEIGNLIAGEVVGSTQQSGDISVYLSESGSGSIYDSVSVPASVDSAKTFAFTGIAEGEYEIAAIYAASNGHRSISAIQQVTIKDHDVTGIRLSPRSAGSLAGRIVMENTSPQAASPECQKSASPFQEILVNFYKQGKPTAPLELALLPDPHASADEKGNFSINDLAPGEYEIRPWLPNDDLYLKSIIKSNADKSTSTQIVNTINIKAASKTDGLVITISHGAAGFSGTVQADKTPQPTALQIYLVPAEADSGDNSFRYYQAVVDKNGSFTIKQVCPGQYWVIARSASIDGDNTRASLRKEVEAAGKKIELKPCQRVQNYVLGKSTVGQ
ncbi:MAG TPA: carboxypeptidase regulatory-like domain-containing protein, partial [Blastocatellia bacterium]|nr:carboxypeptidase regulatory-like domain-containing protein [Blastocatellia bacterium]